MKIKNSNYSIEIVKEDFDDKINDFFNKQLFSKIFVLVDENTEKYCLNRIKSLINDLNVIKINSGEENKNINTCQYIWEQLTELKADRKSLLINLGGGVIGDMGGFCASTFKRGIKFINIPTTLLSQVDASIGSKLGIDFMGLKNQIGLFNDPEYVLINTSFLKTLDERQLLSGYAEILKHSLISNKIHFDLLIRNYFFQNNNLERIINESINIKKSVVEQDPFEQGLRKILNFGHTIGHAIETESILNDNDPLLHGEAVAIGIICELFLSNKILNFPEKEFLETISHIKKNFKFKKKILENDKSKIIDLMKNDKKNLNGKVNFSLLKNIGIPKIDINVTEKLILDSLDFYNSNY